MLIALLLSMVTYIPSIQGQINGELRLVDSNEISFPRQVAGRLEIFLNGAWGTVCVDGFDVYEADIACQQLGFLYADRVGAVGEMGFDEGMGPIWLDEVDCNDVVSLTLADCASSPFIDCSHSQDVALRCSVDPISPLRLVSQTGRTTDLSAGRLEIFINDEWGTVCDDGFDIDDANVACSQMGLTEAVAYGSAGNLGYPGDVSSPIWLDDLTCSSSSPPNLRFCDHSGTGRHNCDHSEDVILSCLAEGNLRLVDDFTIPTTILSAGRLEIYLQNEWGTVCDDSFSVTEADIACRQLGYAGATDHGNNLGISLTSLFTPIWLDQVDCSFFDTTLLSCDHLDIGVHDCVHLEDVELRCGNMSDSTGFFGTTTEIPVVLPTAGSEDFPLVTVVGAAVGGVLLLVTCTCIICIVSCALCSYQHRKNRTSTNVTVAPPPPLSITTTTAPMTQPPQGQKAAFENITPIQQVPPPSYEMALSQPQLYNPSPAQYPPEVQNTPRPLSYNPAFPPQLQNTPPVLSSSQILYYPQAQGPPQVQYPPQAPPPQSTYPPQDGAYPQMQTTAFTAPYLPEAEGQPYAPPPPSC